MGCMRPGSAVIVVCDFNQLCASQVKVLYKVARMAYGDIVRKYEVKGTAFQSL